MIIYEIRSWSKPDYYEDAEDVVLANYLKKETAEKELKQLIEDNKQAKLYFDKCQNCPINKSISKDDDADDLILTDNEIFARDDAHIEEAKLYCDHCLAHHNEDNTRPFCENEMYNFDDVYYYIKEVEVKED